MKNFNMSNCWGRVGKIKSEKSDQGTPYISIELECPNNLFGNVRTYGRLWGQDKIDAFMDFYKKSPGHAFRFKGFFSQFDGKEGMRFSNHTFISWQPYEGNEFRVAFILLGQVVAKNRLDDGDEKIILQVIREGSEGYKDIEENFEIFALKPEDLDNISTGDTVHIKGLLRYKEPEDYFGAAPTKGVIRPYAMEIVIKA